MKIIVGNKTKDISKEEILNKLENYNKVVIDIGTGDGRFVHKNALLNKDTFYIGIDPSETQLKDYSKKSVRNKLENVLYAVGSIELIPEELENLANKVVINFPWGSLLGGIAKAEENIVQNIAKILKSGGMLEMTFGYSEKAEPSETERLELKEFSLDTLEKDVVKSFEENGFKLQFIEQLEKDEIFEIESSWAKRLKFGQERKIFQLLFVKK